MPTARVSGWVALLLLVLALGGLREILMRHDQRRLAARLEASD